MAFAHSRNLCSLDAFVGKTKPSPDGSGRMISLSLSAHCLDVACVFRRLVDLPTIRARLEQAAGAAHDANQLDRLAVIALLHDLGKANLGFQAKLRGQYNVRAGHVREIAPLLFEPSLAGRLEEAIGAISGWFSRPDDTLAYLLASWSHHGVPLSLVRLEERTGTYERARREWWQPNGHGHDPFSGVAELLVAAREAFPAAFQDQAPPLHSSPALQHRFAGLVMLADWLGSHEAFFPISRPKPFDARVAAGRAVTRVGLNTTTEQDYLASDSGTFEKRFGFPPRPVQATVSQLPAHAPDSRLLVVEAETGSGKTEAALDRFFRLFAAGTVGSLYFALPTRVAAREIYQRVVRYVARNFPDSTCRPIALLAVPGYARVDNEAPETLLPDPAVQYDEEDQARRERQWAAERPKRFLAAPIAVGTVDQALLSAVQTRHAHLRSVCLDRSLLVVDEVHASDPYMQALLEQLLAHHVGQGGHALLLSATLGAHARTRLIEAAGGDGSELDLEQAIYAPYPALTTLDGVTRSVAPTSGHAKQVMFELEPWMDQPHLSLERIAAALKRGARVLVITNTVGRAIALQRAAETDPRIPTQALFRCGDVVCPHHGRFTPADRELMDHAVSESFGQGSEPGPLLLIGTQTLEQSLDIDADLLVTDLCPADVLLQRVGRLHRHVRRRPLGHEDPRCIVLAPAAEDLVAFLDKRGDVLRAVKAGGLGSVYEDLRTLELTRRFLTSIPKLSLPADNRRFVEAATHPAALAQLKGERWAKHGERVEGGVISKELTAHHVAAVYDQPFGEVTFQELEGSRVQTRLGLDTLRVEVADPVPSPFGTALCELVIPGHLAPRETPEGPAQVLRVSEGTIHLGLGEREYRYSRLGLEGGDGFEQPAH